jgi:DNA polymerase
MEIKNCQKCGLREQCTQTVPGEGEQQAVIMFVGEGPGQREDQQGIPFVGRAGALLRQSIMRAGIKPELHYITNIVRCRPPENRDPFPDEIEACWPWMLQTLKLIAPKILVPLGKSALYPLARQLGFSNKVGQLTITKLAGKPFYVEKRSLYVMPLFHPAYCLRRSDAREEFESHMLYLGKAYQGWCARK